METANQLGDTEGAFIQLLHQLLLGPSGAHVAQPEVAGWRRRRGHEHAHAHARVGAQPEVQVSARWRLSEPRERMETVGALRVQPTVKCEEQENDQDTAAAGRIKAQGS